MSEFDRRPDFMRDIEDLKKGQRANVLDYTPTSHAIEPDGGVQFPDGISTGGAQKGPDAIIGVLPPSPGALTVVLGSTMNVVYADVSWPVPDGFGSAQVVEYEVTLAKVADTNYTEIYPETYGTVGQPMVTKKQETLISVDRVSERTIRLEPLEPLTDYIVRVRSVNNLGFGSQFAAETTFTSGKDDTIPVQVTGLYIGAGLRTITAIWNDNPDADVKNGNGTYELQVADDENFTVNLRSATSSGSIASIGDLAPNTQYFVRVRAIDASGNLGDWSVTMTETTAQAISADIADLAITTTKITDEAISTPKLVAGAVTTVKLAAFAVDATKIQAGTIIADSAIIADGAITNAKIGDAQITSAKILSLTAAKITTGTLDAATISVGSSGVIIAGDITNGVRINAFGITQFQGGAATVQIPTSGNAYFEGSLYATGEIYAGTFSTGTSGRYVRMTNGSQDRIQWINNGVVSQSIVGTDDGLSLSGGELKLASNALNFADTAGLRAGNNGVRNEIQSRPIVNGVVDTNSYVDMAAITFRTTSLRKYKRNIKTPPGGALGRVRAAAKAVALFNLADDPEGTAQQLGYIADGMPESTRMGDGYSLNALVAELSLALVEVADTLPVGLK